MHSSQMATHQPRRVNGASMQCTRLSHTHMRHPCSSQPPIRRHLLQMVCFSYCNWNILNVCIIVTPIEPVSPPQHHHENDTTTSPHETTSDKSTENNYNVENNIAQHHQLQHQHMDGDLKQQCKLFIGGLHWKTQDSDLKDYFSKMGTVTDAMVIWWKLRTMFWLFNRSFLSQTRNARVALASLSSRTPKRHKMSLLIRSTKSMAKQSRWNAPSQRT